VNDLIPHEPAAIGSPEWIDTRIAVVRAMELEAAVDAESKARSVRDHMQRQRGMEKQALEMASTACILAWEIASRLPEPAVGRGVMAAKFLTTRGNWGWFEDMSPNVRTGWYCVRDVPEVLLREYLAQAAIDESAPSRSGLSKLGQAVRRERRAEREAAAEDPCADVQSDETSVQDTTSPAAPRANPEAALEVKGVRNPGQPAQQETPDQALADPGPAAKYRLTLPHTGDPREASIHADLLKHLGYAFARRIESEPDGAHAKRLYTMALAHLNRAAEVLEAMA